jgi:DNA polymerase
LLRSRGEMQLAGRGGYVTVHPSYLLRLPDEAAKRIAFKDFGNDLRKIRELAGV